MQGHKDNRMLFLATNDKGAVQTPYQLLMFQKQFPIDSDGQPDGRLSPTDIYVSCFARNINA